MSSGAREGRVLVTGAGGFIGGATAARLAADGYEVHGVGRTAIDHPAVSEAHQVDLLDQASTARLIDAVRPAYLMHLAWTTEHGVYWADERNLDWISATLGLLRAFHSAHGARAVLIGSCTEYDWARTGPFAESDAGPRPQTLYGASKLATSIAATGFGEAVGLDVAWARIFHLYGPGEDARRILPQLVSAAEIGEPLELRQPDQVIDVLHVDDVAGALSTLLASSLTGTCNVASGEEITIAGMGRIVDELSGGRSHTVPEHVQSAAASVVGDVTRLRDVAGFTPRYDLREGLSQTRAWMLDQAKGARS